MSKATLLLVGTMVLGGIYGYVSALLNANPYALSAAEGMTPEKAAQVPLGKAWRPSPLWLPSYLVCVVPRRTERPKNPLGLTGVPKEVHIVGYGQTNTDDRGYICGGPTDRTLFRLASTFAGIGMGLILGGVMGLATGWITIRKKRDEDAA